MMEQANLVSWHACFSSLRFWQYFFMNAFGTYLYSAFFNHFDKAGHGTTSTLIRMATCPIAAVMYELLGFRITHSMLMILNIVIASIGLSIDLEVDT